MEKKDFCRKLGAQIRKVREQKGYSQDRLQLEAGMGRGNLTRIESGAVEPRAFTLYRFADILGVPVKKFFDFN